MKFLNNILPLFLPFSVSIAFFVGSLYMLEALPFFKPVSFDIMALASMDFFLTLLVCFLVFAGNRNRVKQMNCFFRTTLRSFLNKYFILFIAISGFLAYKAYTNLYLVIVVGLTRSGLMENVGLGYLDQLLPQLVNVLFIISVVYGYRKKVIIVLFLGALSAMLFYLSRTNLIFMILFSLTLISFKGEKLSVGKGLLLLLLLVSVVLFAAYITVLQGRRESLGLGVLSVTETIFRYKAFSYYLAPIAIDNCSNVDRFLFPFLGWTYERVYNLFSEIPDPVGVASSTFIVDFHQIGPLYHANVAYPWWSWFYGSFGVIGLFLKAVYSYLISVGLLRLKLYVTFSFWFYTLVIVSNGRHPFLGSSHIYGFVILIILDVVVHNIKKIRYKKRRSVTDQMKYNKSDT